MKKQRMLWLALLLAPLLALPALQSGQSQAQEGARLFPETGKTLRGRFLQYWLENGGLRQNGYPISDELRERSELDGKEYTMQYFERAIFELHPENQPPYDVLLSQLGTFRYRQKYASGNGNPTGSGTLTPTGSMSVARAAHSATLLKDGKVLIVGGMQRDGALLASAELYDSATSRFAPTGNLAGERVGHTATRLPDGRALIVGGFGPRQLSTAEIYDPSTGRFTATGSMGKARGGHTATLLSGGKILIAGGNDSSEWHAGAELYDPATGRFSPTGSMAEARSAHASALLPDGRVLVVGGSAGARGSVLASAEIYDPAKGAFTPTGSMTSVRHKHAATLLANGQVLVVGGSDNRDWRGKYRSAELYDPAKGAFTPAESMSVDRFKLADATAPLSDGRLLVSGGNKRVEVYTPSDGFSVVVGETDADRFYQTATTLPDGRVLITGGYDDSITATVGAWVYKP